MDVVRSYFDGHRAPPPSVLADAFADAATAARMFADREHFGDYTSLLTTDAWFFEHALVHMPGEASRHWPRDVLAMVDALDLSDIAYVRLLCMAPSLVVYDCDSVRKRARTLVLNAGEHDTVAVRVADLMHEVRLPRDVLCECVTVVAAFRLWSNVHFRARNALETLSNLMTRVKCHVATADLIHDVETVWKHVACYYPEYVVNSNGIMNNLINVLLHEDATYAVWWPARMHARALLMRYGLTFLLYVSVVTPPLLPRIVQALPTVLPASRVEALRRLWPDPITDVVAAASVATLEVAAAEAMLADGMEAHEATVTGSARGLGATGATHDDDAAPSVTCPITLERVVHPVVVSDGYTYERSAFLKHIVTSRSFTSPMTRMPIDRLLYA
jgi:hypothetical protein